MRRNGRAACAGASIAFILAVPAPAEQVVTWSEVAAARLPHPRELETEALLAEAAAAAAGAGGLLLEAPTASFSTGPRRSTDEETTAVDVTVEVELPLLAERRRRLDLATALHQTGDAMRASAAAIALADLAAAYARSWLAQASIELRRQGLAITEAWLEAVERRVAAGADPPYEAILVAGERDRTLLGLLDARRESELRWGELGRLASIPPEPSPLDLSSLPGAAAALERRAETAAATAAAADGIAARRQLAILLARARSAAASSRWAFAGDAGREGDEQVARVGLAYRFALNGERAAIADARSAAETRARAEATADLGTLRARVTAAQAALASSAPSFDARDLETAQQALDSRLAEGKERASQVLPLRRQLLEAMLATAGARAARAQAAAELFFLEGGKLP